MIKFLKQITGIERRERLQEEFVAVIEDHLRWLILISQKIGYEPEQIERDKQNPETMREFLKRVCLEDTMIMQDKIDKLNEKGIKVDPNLVLGIREQINIIERT